MGENKSRWNSATQKALTHFLQTFEPLSKDEKVEKRLKTRKELLPQVQELLKEHNIDSPQYYASIQLLYVGCRDVIHARRHLAGALEQLETLSSRYHDEILQDLRTFEKAYRINVETQFSVRSARMSCYVAPRDKDGNVLRDEQGHPLPGERLTKKEYVESRLKNVTRPKPSYIDVTSKKPAVIHEICSTSTQGKTREKPPQRLVSAYAQ